MKQQKQWIAAAVTAALALTLASGALASGAGRHTDAERLEPCRDLSALEALPAVEVTDDFEQAVDGLPLSGSDKALTVQCMRGSFRIYAKLLSQRGQ